MLTWGQVGALPDASVRSPPVKSDDRSRLVEQGRLPAHLWADITLSGAMVGEGGRSGNRCPRSRKREHHAVHPARHADANASPEPNVLIRPVPKEPGAFRQGRIIGGFVVLDWANRRRASRRGGTAG